MSRLLLGSISGIVYGALSALSMLPLEFPDKRAALLGAFLNRFTIGVVIGAAIGVPQLAVLRMPPWFLGFCFGVLLSAADAVITKAYAPILILGAIGGALIGWFVGRFGRGAVSHQQRFSMTVGAGSTFALAFPARPR